MMEIFKGLAVFCLTLTILVSVVNAGISCKSEDNKDVDWFFIYKFPKEAKNTNKENKNKNNLFKGDEYVYVDSNTPPSAAYWTVSFKKISDHNSALANTIAPLTEKEKAKDLTYAVYNDEVQGTPFQKHGHTKGLFLFDRKKGVWLIHSVPSFPEFDNHKSAFFPERGLAKSQIFLCVTFPSTELETIAQHLRLQHPKIYANAFASDSNKDSHTYRLLNKDFITASPWNLTANLTDVAGNTYTSFATHPKFLEDVYSCLVAPTLQSHLLVSTWQNGPGGRVPDHCNGSLTVTNVNAEKLNFTLGLRVSKLAKNSVDHGKLAISSSGGNTYVCVGTLNRMTSRTPLFKNSLSMLHLRTKKSSGVVSLPRPCFLPWNERQFSQYKRGGETLCFRNKLLHRLLLNTVTSVEKHDVVEMTKKKQKENKEKVENKKKEQKKKGKKY